MLSERKSKDGIRMWCRYDYHNCTSPCAADRTCMRLEDIGTTGRGKEEERLLFDLKRSLVFVVLSSSCCLYRPSSVLIL